MLKSSNDGWPLKTLTRLAVVLLTISRRNIEHRSSESASTGLRQLPTLCQWCAPPKPGNTPAEEHPMSGLGMWRARRDKVSSSGSHSQLSAQVAVPHPLQSIPPSIVIAHVTACASTRPNPDLQVLVHSIESRARRSRVYRRSPALSRFISQKGKAVRPDGAYRSPSWPERPVHVLPAHASLSSRLGRRGNPNRTSTTSRYGGTHCQSLLQHVSSRGSSAGTASFEVYDLVPTHLRSG